MYFEFNSPHVPIKLVQTYALLLTGFRWWPRVTNCFKHVSKACMHGTFNIGDDQLNQISENATNLF